jgi:hypothetical protein
LNRVIPERPRFPRANIADLSIVVVIPALPGNRIRNRFAEFMRTRGSQSVGDSEAAGASGTSGLRHHRVENIVARGVVVAAEILAGGSASLLDLHAWRQEKKVQ